MSEKIFIDWEEALAAVKFQGQWQFFHAWEPMFILDYTAYDDEYVPSLGGFRYGTMIVDKDNAEQWMNSLGEKLSLEQACHVYWENTEKRVRLTFVIDFDKKLWVGSGWKMDQSPFTEYQPQGWIAIEDNVLNYLPDDLKSYFE